MKASEAGMKVGDVVQLKSGGPKMTIHDIDEWNKTIDRAQCYFFKEDDTCSDITFPIATLNLVKTETV
ncbi:DUF2158 domain-containing protein [Siphonobacter sp. BAB-5405]|uniref:DUF2158 domain-containing protein n=1 Tax=Siphonobacter sp. BAB-5405 TaxID=1864825 RepID=UPI000C80CFC2|nr:DUF2158 domain-containing protein [Siphonobacter sp. BAB-5405]